MKKTILPLLLFGVFCLQAQSNQQQRFSFGMMAGVESQTLGASYIPNHVAGTPYAAIKRASLGASIGCFGQWQLTQSIAFRPQLVFAVTDNYIDIVAAGEILQHLRYRFSDIELPVHLVATNRVGQLPIRGSLLFGARVSWNASENTSAQKTLNLYRERTAIDIGLGVEFQSKNWKIKPEVIYSYGMNNVHNLADSPSDWSVGRMVRDRLALRVLVWK